MRWIGLALALTIAFWLRAVTGISTEAPFNSDPAFHLRMTERCLSGDLGEVDRLRLHPDGVRITELQPTGLYRTAAVFHRIVEPVTGSLNTSVRLLTALAGALMVIPVFAMARTVHGSNAAALAAALTIAVMPAHADRTFSNVFRFDALGSLAVACHLWLLIAVLGRTRGSALVSTAGVAILTFLCLAVWRASLAVIGLEALMVGIVAVVSPGPRSREIGLGLLAGLVLSLALEYVRVQEVWLSRSAVVTTAVALALVVRSLGPFDRGWVRYAVLLTGLVVLATFLVPAGRFDLEEGSAFRALLARNGIGSADPFLVVLYTFVKELGAPGLHVLAKPEIFSYTAPVALAGAIGVGLGIRRSGWHRPRPASLLLLGLGVVWLVATALFDRNKVLAAIPIAVLAGGIGTWLRTGRPVARLAAWGALILCLGLSARDTLARGRETTVMVEPEFARVCGWLEENVPPGSGVAADWGQGYGIQMLAGRGTFTDGYLESSENRERIRAFSRALVASDPGVLLDLCRSHRIDALVLHQGNGGLPFVYAGLVPPPSRSGGVIRIPPSALQTLTVRLTQHPESVPELPLAFAVGPYRVFRIPGRENGPDRSGG